MEDGKPGDEDENSGDDESCDRRPPDPLLLIKHRESHISYVTDLNERNIILKNNIYLIITLTLL